MVKILKTYPAIMLKNVKIDRKRRMRRSAFFLRIFSSLDSVLLAHDNKLHNFEYEETKNIHFLDISKIHFSLFI